MKRLTKYLFLFFPFCLFFPSPILDQVLTLRSGSDVQTPQHEHSINTKAGIPKGPVASNDLGRYHILKQIAAGFNSKMPMRFNIKYAVLQLKFYSLWLQTPSEDIIFIFCPQFLAQGLMLGIQKMSSRWNFEGDRPTVLFFSYILQPWLFNHFVKLFYVCLQFFEHFTYLNASGMYFFVQHGNMILPHYEMPLLMYIKPPLILNSVYSSLLFVSSCISTILFKLQQLLTVL